jgi:hypothetical protein|tara:strand:- start:484 stop:1458 length:975 start_codon:yes stop_codon:yes gene_type:complete
MDKTRGDIFITIRSRDLISTAIGDNNNAGRFNLFQNIIAEENEILAVELVSATIPNSFYNLSNNNNNNKIKFKEGANAYVELTIPSGSYSIIELGTKLKELLEAQSTTWGNGYTYTFSYDEINNLLTITNSGNDAVFDFTGDNTCRRFLGFTSSIQTISDANGITSDRAVDITDTRNSIFIRLPNLNNSKVIESNNGKFSNVIAQVPVELSRNTFFTFEPPQSFKCELAQQQINSIDILITYQDETNNVNFERADWEINLIISFFKAPQSVIKTRRSDDEGVRRMLNEVDTNLTKMETNKKETEELKSYFQEKIGEWNNLKLKT